MFDNYFYESFWFLSCLFVWNKVPVKVQKDAGSVHLELAGNHFRHVFHVISLNDNFLALGTILDTGTPGKSLGKGLGNVLELDALDRVHTDHDGGGLFPVAGDLLDENARLVLDGLFGLAPGLSPLAESYRAGELLPVQGLSIPYRTRSHFDAQSILETGLDRPVGSASGWLNRTLEVLGGSTSAGIAVGGPLPLSMQGRVPVATWAPSASRSGSEGFIEDLSQLYNLDPTLADPFTAALTLQEQAMDMDGTGNRSRRGLAQFQQLFSATGRFMNAPDGARIASLEFSGWDTHVGQGLADGTLDRRLLAADSPGMRNSCEEKYLLAGIEHHHHGAENHKQ